MLRFSIVTQKFIQNMQAQVLYNYYYYYIRLTALFPGQPG